MNRTTRIALAIAACVATAACGQIATDAQAASDAPGVHSRLVDEQNALGRCVLDDDALVCTACLVPVDTYQGPCGPTGMKVLRVPTQGGPAIELARDAGTPAWLLAAGGGYVYWMGDPANDGPDAPELHPLRRVRRDGGAIETLLPAVGLAPRGEQVAVGMVATSDGVAVLYERFGATPGLLSVVTWQTATGAPRVLSTEETPPETTVLAVPFATDGTSFFYAPTDRLSRVDPDGTTTRLLSISEPMKDIAVTGDRVTLLGNPGDLVQVSTRGTNSVTTKLRGRGLALAVDATGGVYTLLDRGHGQSNGVVARVDPATGDSHDLTNVTEVDPTQLLVDARNLYWVTSAAGPGASNVSGQVIRMRKP